MKTILVVGGTGFIGFNLIKKINKNKNKIYSISTHYPKKKYKTPKVNYIICNITKKKEIKKKLKKISFDYVINLGGYIDHSNKKKTLESHLDGCKNLFQFFKDKKLKNFIQIGSSLEYANLSSPQKETKINIAPKSYYARAKFEASNYIVRKSKQFNIPFTILRLYQIYGPHQKKNRLIPLAIKSCLNRKKFKCTDGLQKRDFLYVDDLSSLIIKVLKKKNITSGIYNVGYGQPISVRDVIIKIQQICKGGFPLFGKIKMRDDEIAFLFPNINKISKYFKWKPKTNIFKGLKKTIRYYEKN